MTRKKVRRPHTASYISYDELEQYGLGSWLKKNASWLAPVAGAGLAIGTAGLLAPAGAAVGAAGAGAGAAAGAGAGAAAGAIPAATGVAGSLSGITGSTLASTVGSTAASGLSTSAALTAGGLGASMGSSIGGAVSNNYAQDQAQAQQNAAMSQNNAKGRAQSQLQVLQAADGQQQPMGTVARYGGRLRRYAKGGPLTGTTTITPNQRAATDSLKNYQGILTGALAEQTKGLYNVDSILNANATKPFNRGNIDKYSEEIIKNQGDFALTPDQQKVALGNEYPNYVRLANKYKTDIANYSSGVSTKGTVEKTSDASTENFGARNMIERYPWNISEGTPYSYLNNLPKKSTGGLINYDGQSHEGPDGGIPVDGTGSVNLGQPSALVEGGEVGKNPGNGGETYVYSDKLEMRKGETFADAAKKLQSRYKLRMKDGKITDPISKKAFDKESKELENNQEALKQAMEITGGDIKMRTGGRIKMLRTLATGGELELIMPNLNTQVTGAAPKLPTGSEVYTNLGGTPPVTASAPNWETYSGGSAGMAAAGMAAPILGNIIGQVGANRRAKNRVKLDESGAAPAGISLERERASAREQANLARANTRRALKGGASAQQYMANVGASEVGIQRALGDQVGQSYQKEEMYNNQLPSGGPSEQAKLQAQMYNAQLGSIEDAQRQQRMNNVLNTVNQGTAGYMRSKQDAALMQMMNPNVELQESGPWYRRKYRTRER